MGPQPLRPRRGVGAHTVVSAALIGPIFPSTDVMSAAGPFSSGAGDSILGAGPNTPLGLSTTTVRNYIANVLSALGAHTRLQAVVAARKAGLIDL